MDYDYEESRRRQEEAERWRAAEWQRAMDESHRKWLEDSAKAERERQEAWNRAEQERRDQQMRGGASQQR